jgi:GTP cyclohydrolase II
MQRHNGNDGPPQLGLNGDPAALAIDRAIAELRRGRFIAISDNTRCLIVTALETARPATIARLHVLPGEAVLILTAERAAASLNSNVVGPVQIPLDTHELARLPEFAGMNGQLNGSESAQPAAIPWQGSPLLASAGFRLAKAARLLPALVGVETTAAAIDDSVARVTVADVERHSATRAIVLKRISESRVPLTGAEDSTITLFRDEYGAGEHVAVIIGQPKLDSAVPVRLHSACLTGDVLGSLRCDCGEQLQTAVQRIAALGGGVLLYLDQEGRGIGLANKLRAYSMQDLGLDTLDADRHLGFSADERSYEVAAGLLTELQIESVQLLTNNPLKISALREHGINVVGRLPLVAATNVHNERYIRAKRERAGHLSEDTGS